MFFWWFVGFLLVGFWVVCVCDVLLFLLLVCVLSFFGVVLVIFGVFFLRCIDVL